MVFGFLIFEFFPFLEFRRGIELPINLMENDRVPLNISIKNSMHQYLEELILGFLIVIFGYHNSEEKYYSNEILLHIFYKTKGGGNKNHYWVF